MSNEEIALCNEFTYFRGKKDPTIPTRRLQSVSCSNKLVKLTSALVEAHLIFKPEKSFSEETCLPSCFSDHFLGALPVIRCGERFMVTHLGSAAQSGHQILALGHQRPI